VRRRLVALLIAALVVAATVVLVWPEEDDVPVDPTTPAAQAAIDAALEVVPGRVRGVYRDRDNGKWEVAIAQSGREYEVELAAGDLALLRLDYD
jgi:uncharacterized membrane protein YkoI